MNENIHIYDVLAIGFGPSNIGLAVALEEMNAPLDVLFLESKNSCKWQPGMLFPNSDIQNHPLRDLVTPRNPRSHYSFTNFLFENNRLFEHLNLGLLFPSRIEYAQYVAWVASHFDHQVRYNKRVAALRVVPFSLDHAPLYEVRCEDGTVYKARALVVAPGRTPYIPDPFSRVNSRKIVHLNDYLMRIHEFKSILRQGRIAVVGSSQSAIEIMLHLSQEFPEAQIVGVSRRFGYRLKDTSPFTGEVYFPKFVDLFYDADKQTKQRLRDDLHFTNYSAADGDILNQLYQRMYSQRLLGQDALSVLRSSDVVGVQEVGEAIQLEIVSTELGAQANTHSFDLVVLATGFRDIGGKKHQEHYPALVEPLVPFLDLDAEGCLRIGKDYRLFVKSVLRGAPIYMNGLCESSHGMGDAGSFSLLSLRSKTIVESLTDALSLRHGSAHNKDAVSSDGFPMPLQTRRSIRRAS